MSKGTKNAIMILVALVLVGGLVAYFKWRVPSKLDVVSAVDRDLVTVEAQGINVGAMKITLTSTRNMEILIPVGALFMSQSGGTQNMMAAETVRFVFTNARRDFPQSVTQEIRVYCINRFLEAPTEKSLFQVSYTEETNPIRKLAACLENHDADHYSKQIAIWMVSDKFLNMTFEEVVEKMTGYILSHGDPIDADKLIDMIKTQFPELTEGQIRAIINSPEMREMREESVRKATREMVEEYASKSGPLLETCGYHLKDSKFFQL